MNEIFMKSADIPSYCGECDIGNYEWEDCEVIKENFDSFSKTRLKNCPIKSIEVHDKEIVCNMTKDIQRYKDLYEYHKEQHKKAVLKITRLNKKIEELEKALKEQKNVKSN